MFKLSLVIPCFNEASSLPVLISRCEEVFLNKSVEVVLVDNGSTDNTPQVMKDHIRESYIKNVRVKENKGYGYGIMFGLNKSSGEFLGWTHADLQTDVADVLQALDELKKNNFNDRLFIKGRRSGRSIADRFFTFGMSAFETILLRKFMYDINAQPTVFSREFYKSWSNPPHDFSIDLFSYYMAKKESHIFKRIPVVFFDRQFGQSHWNVNWKNKINFIIRTLKYSVKLKKSIKNVTIQS